MSGKHCERVSDDSFSRNRQIVLPSLLLSGKWLQDCGFRIGERVNVSCEAGKLVITLLDKHPA